MNISRHRMTVIAFGIAASMLLPFASAQAGFKTFSVARYETAKQSGKAFVLDFYADWCTTCKAQHRAIKKMQTNAAYNSIDVFVVDWDARRTKGSDEAKLIKALDIPRRSTLVLFKNGKEVDRVVAQTRSKVIKALFDQGL